MLVEAGTVAYPFLLNAARVAASMAGAVGSVAQWTAELSPRLGARAVARACVQTDRKQ